MLHPYRAWCVVSAGLARCIAGAAFFLLAESVPCAAQEAYNWRRARASTLADLGISRRRTTL